MIGAIAGDIIGSVYESGWVKTKRFRLFSDESTFTDDTVLTVATMDCLLGSMDFSDCYREYWNRYPKRGYGKYFNSWASGPKKENNYSWGNGAAMRVSPVGLICDDLASVLDISRKSALCTHSHPEGIKGAQAIACAVFLSGKKKDKDYIKDYTTDTFGYLLDEPIDSIRKWYSFDSTAKGSVPFAIRAFIESADFEDAVRLAVSLGGDSDTLACMAGAISEAYYKEIPGKIKEEVFNRIPEDFRKVIRRFYNKTGKRYP